MVWFRPIDTSENIHTFFKRVEAQFKAQPAPKAKPSAEPLKDNGGQLYRNLYTVPPLFETALIRQPDGMPYGAP